MSKSTTLPANIPSVAHARLPSVYTQAKTALAQCERIDECKDWGDKMAALASYAKQAQDETLMKHAMRIQSRAIRRAGELLAEVDPQRGGDRGGGRGNQRDGRGPLVSRTQVARDAGMSDRQRKTALRVAAVDADKFEALVESDSPPTVTTLAELGTEKQPRQKDPHGRSHAEIQAGIYAYSRLEELADFMKRTPPRVVAKGEILRRAQMVKNSIAIRGWLSRLEGELE